MEKVIPSSYESGSIFWFGFLKTSCVNQMRKGVVLALPPYFDRLGMGIQAFGLC